MLSAMAGSRHTRSDFIEVYNAAPSLEVAAQRLGVTARAVRLRLARLRQKGLPLPVKADESERRQERSGGAQRDRKLFHVQAWLEEDCFRALQDEDGRVTSERVRAIIQKGLVHGAHCEVANALRQI